MRQRSRSLPVEWERAQPDRAERDRAERDRLDAERRAVDNAEHARQQEVRRRESDILQQAALGRARARQPELWMWIQWLAVRSFVSLWVDVSVECYMCLLHWDLRRLLKEMTL